MRAAKSRPVRHVGLCCVVLGLITLSPALAGDWSLRVLGQAVVSDLDPLGLGVEFDTGSGLYAGAEYRWNARLGLEIGVGWLELEQSAKQDLIISSFATTATLTARPVSLGLNVHLLPESRFDLYVAPRLGWALVDDLELDTRVDVRTFPFPTFPGIPTFPTFPGLGAPFRNDLATEDQFFLGLRLGFDVAFGESAWSLASAVDYSDLELELSAADAVGLGIDPLTVGIGFGYRF